MRLVLPVPPSANRWWRQSGDRLYTPTRVTAFKHQVMVACRTARLRKLPREQAVCVTLWWYRKAKQGDLDKRIGILLDALQGHAYEDDVQVAELHCFRYEDKANPRLEVEVTALAAQAAA
jgi:Holliday junction resolvase RusA-like endonuclease